MRPCDCLEGLQLDGGWRVDSVVDRPVTSTGGKFSVGYLVVNDDGRQGFLKALDFSAALQAPDPARALEPLVKAYNFERDLLARCRDKKLRRVVTAMADGTVDVPGPFGEVGRVPYLIFELASGDIRNEVAKWKDFDLAWALRSLHESAVGLQELHLMGIAHQDLKPSNVLVFPVDGSRVSDLGRASHKYTPSECDEMQIPGEVAYAPPEQWYGWQHSTDFSRRYVADLYHLGSLLFFFFSNCSATHAIFFNLSRSHGKAFTRSGFVEDLPYLQHAFGAALAELQTSVQGVAGPMADEIVTIARQLCEPDPKRRGDPRARAASHRPQHDLQPYISRFDRLAKTAEGKMV